MLEGELCEEIGFRKKVRRDGKLCDHFLSVAYEENCVILCLHSAHNRQFSTPGFFMLKSILKTAKKLA